MIVMTDIAKKIISRHRPAYGVAVDMTVGNGNDTLFLAKIASTVYGFDIQAEALSATQKRLKDNHITNCQLFETGHEHFDIRVPDNVDLAVYNLGYLPGGDKTITTQAQTTLESLERLLPKLNKNALVVLVVYQGHDDKEKQALEAYARTLPVPAYDVFSFSSLNTVDAPSIIGIIKK